MRYLSVIVAFLALAPVPARAQQPEGDDVTVEVLRAVVAHRVLNAEDEAPFQACTLYGFLGGLDALVRRLGPLAENAFDRVDDPCAPTEPVVPRVELLGMRLGPSMAQVALQFVGVERSYIEQYTLRPPPAILEGVTLWVVDDVRR